MDPIKSDSRLRPSRQQSSETLRWSDYTDKARDRISSNAKAAGATMPQRLSERRDTLAAEHAQKGSLTSGKTKELRNLNDIDGHVRSTNVTLTTAANRRIGLTERAQRDAHARSEGGAVIPEGTGWYFEHHGAITQAADKHGIDHDRAIVASAVMSPQNAPESERKGAAALFHAHTEGKVEFNDHVVSALRSAGHTVPEDHVGRVLHGSEVDAPTLAALSTRSIRDRVQPHTNVDLEGVAAGGTKENVVKATQVIRGDVHHDDAINPRTAPKVWAYAHNTRLATPNTATHSEYMNRVEHASNPAHANQPMLDIHGLNSSRQGLLGADHHTVEDTWQNTITHGQSDKTVGYGKRTNVAKTVGSHARAMPGATDEVHAYNNEATVRAAKRMSQGRDYDIPAVAVQEIGWTQKRKETGKSRDLTATAKAGRSNHFAGGANAGHYDVGHPDQGSLF